MENRFRLHIMPHLGDRTLSQLAAEPSVIRTWVAGLRGEMADGTVRTTFANLSAALGAAVTDGRMNRNPCALVRPPRAAAGRVQPWSMRQAADVTGALPARYRAAAGAGADLGMRQGEVFGWRCRTLTSCAGSWAWPPMTGRGPRSTPRWPLTAQRRPRRVHDECFTSPDALPLLLRQY